MEVVKCILFAMMCVAIGNCQIDTMCGDNYVMCRDGEKCIPGSWKCDDIRDCSDNSDEENCIVPVADFTEPAQPSQSAGNSLSAVAQLNYFNKPQPKAVAMSDLYNAFLRSRQLAGR